MTKEEEISLAFARKIRNEILKDFTNFLKKHNAYTQYRINIHNSTIRVKKHNDGFFYGISRKITPFSRITYNETVELINYAFNWSTTKQGLVFWAKINQEWRKYTTDKYQRYSLLLATYRE